MRAFIVIAAVLVLGGATGCEPTDACDDFVDYICDCHDGEEGFDCEEVRQTYADADPDVQEQCQIELSNLKEEDEQTGHTCTSDDSGI